MSGKSARHRRRAARQNAKHTNHTPTSPPPLAAESSGSTDGASSAGRTNHARAPAASSKKPGSIHSHAALSRHELMRVAVAAGCDPTCVVRYLRQREPGIKPLRSTTLSRVERALKKCGHAQLVAGVVASAAS